MKVISRLFTAAAFSLVALNLSSQSVAAEIIGGGGNAASKLLQDWASAKPGFRPDLIKFSTSVLANDLTSLQNGSVDFAIVDNPLSEAVLAGMKLQQFPFVLNGVSIMVNLPNNMAGTIRLDGPTLGKIFAGEITAWDDPAITSLNPRHELPDKPIRIVEAGEFSTDYPVLDSYLGSVSAKWKAADNGNKREWPANAIYADSMTNRISTIRNTPYAIAYLPMQYMPQPTLSNVHIKNRDGNFVGLSDVSILASTSTISVKDGSYASLSLTDKNGNGSWPISNFTFIVVKQERLKEESIGQILGVIQYGLKYGSLKPTVHNYVALPDKLAKVVLAGIDPLVPATNTATAGKATTKSAQENAQQLAAQQPAAQKRMEEELNRQRNEAKAAPQDESRRAEERSRAARQLADEQAREQAIREARAAKQAAEEAIRAANAAKLEAEKLAEKNRLIAKAAQDKADREKAERDRIAKAQADKEKAIELRNQKDEDPLEAYRRSVQ